MAGIMLFTYRNSRWEFLMFLFGMAIAEMDLIRGAHTTPHMLPLNEKPHSTRRWRVEPFVVAFMSVVGLYLMSQPDEGAKNTPGWIYLDSTIPVWWKAAKYRYWQCTGAALFIVCVGRSPWWQRVFNSAFVQYFGKISYALYLMHGPAIHTAGYTWEKMAFGVTGIEGHQFTAGFVLGSLFVVPTVIWWADVFWRAVDVPTVKLAKWWESKLVVNTE